MALFVLPPGPRRKMNAEGFFHYLHRILLQAFGPHACLHFFLNNSIRKCDMVKWFAHEQLELPAK